MSENNEGDAVRQTQNAGRPVDNRLGELPPEEMVAKRVGGYDFAVLALRSVIIVNGGGAIALLAFLGQIWGKNGADKVIASAAGSLWWFVLGIGAGIVASAAAYQYTRRSRQGLWSKANFFKWTVYVTLSGGLICFAAGAFVAVAAFKMN